MPGERASDGRAPEGWVKTREQGKTDHDAGGNGEARRELTRAAHQFPQTMSGGGYTSVEVQLHLRRVDGVAVLDVTGELDIYTSPKLRSAIQELLTGGTARVVVNLLNTTYLDSTALSVLTSALKQARDAGGTVALVYNQPQIEKIFTITGLHEVFPVYRTETDAVDAARSWPDAGRS